MCSSSFSLNHTLRITTKSYSLKGEEKVRPYITSALRAEIMVMYINAKFKLNFTI